LNLFRMAAEIPIHLKCGICSEICKRGVKVSCCGAVGCRACATKTVTKAKKCWACDKEILSKDLINDEELRKKVANFESGKEEDVKKDAELMKPPANVPAAAVAAKTPEKNITKTAEDEIKAKAAKNIATKRAPPAKTENGTIEPNLKAGKTETLVNIEMMKARDKEFEEKMNAVEKASKELRYGAQLELMFTFDKAEASCRLCGVQLGNEKVTASHLQQQHKIEYGHLKTVLSPPNNNMLQLFLQKAIKSEFLFAKENTFPVAVNY